MNADLKEGSLGFGGIAQILTTEHTDALRTEIFTGSSLWIL